MTPKTKPIPDGFHTLTPHLVVREAAKAIEFYKKAFGAEVKGVLNGPDGKSIMHASLKIGDSFLMLNDEFPPFDNAQGFQEWKCLSPQSVGGSSVTIHLYVEDVDAVYNRAVSVGATATMPVMDAFWGDRYGKLLDPFGHEWSIAIHKEDLSPEEMKKRGEAAMAEMGKQEPLNPSAFLAGLTKGSGAGLPRNIVRGH